MSDERGATWLDGLPEMTRARVSTARLVDGVATVVLDATGLDGAARSALEAETAAQLRGQPGIAEVRVALMGDRAAPAPAAPRRRIVAVGSGKVGSGSRRCRPISPSRWPGWGSRSGWSMPISTVRRSRACSATRG